MDVSYVNIIKRNNLHYQILGGQRMNEKITKINEKIGKITERITKINESVEKYEILDIFHTTDHIFNLISHTDLDGYGCNIVANMHFANNLEREMNVNYDEIDNAILTMLDNIIRSYEVVPKAEYKYNVLCITDISSADPYIIEMIDKINSMDGLVSIYLIDHHATAKKLYSNYWWAIITSDPVSATYLFNIWAKYYLNIIGRESILRIFTLNNQRTYEEIVEIISRYDTWEWMDNPIDKYDGKENYLNVIFKSFKDGDTFVTSIVSMFYNMSLSGYLDIFNEFKDEIDEYKSNIDKAVDRLSNISIKFRHQGHIVSIGFCHSPYMSEVANRYLKNNEDVDYIMILNVENRVVSFRSTRDDINLGEIAKVWSCDGKGGGHPKAAGATISIDDTLCLLEKFYGRLDDDEVV